MGMDVQDVLKLVEEKGVKVIDYKFSDMLGRWHHFSTPVHEFGEEIFEDGLSIDGSSFRGWQPINNSDMIIIPEPATARIDPFVAMPTLSLICNVFEPLTREGYTRDPRFVAQKAEAYLQSTGVADVAYFGVEPEFFVFDSVRSFSGPNEAFYSLDSMEGGWNSGRDERPNLGYKPRLKEGYYPCPPTDSLADLRNEMVEEMLNIGIHVECMHHEVATGGQCEIDMRFNTLVAVCDDLQWFKYVARNVAHRNGRTVTFMPKPLYGDNGSGMHCHQSLWRGGKNLFVGDGYAGLSEMALHYMGGIMKHAKALCAFTNPVTNSYRRLVPGFEAPINLAYSSSNRSASLRLPVADNPKARRVEYRTPDPACNGYLAFAALLMAGLDGIENRIDPGPPLDKDIYGLSPEELRHVPHVAGTLGEALDCLEADHEFLLKGDVFTRDLIEKWLSWKREHEIKPMMMHPVPLEFELYFDC